MTSAKQRGMEISTEKRVILKEEEEKKEKKKTINYRKTRNP